MISVSTTVLVPLESRAADRLFSPNAEILQFSQRQEVVALRFFEACRCKICCSKRAVFELCEQLVCCVAEIRYAQSLGVFACQAQECRMSGEGIWHEVM